MRDKKNWVFQNNRLLDPYNGNKTDDEVAKQVLGKDLDGRVIVQQCEICGYSEYDRTYSGPSQPIKGQICSIKPWPEHSFDGNFTCSSCIEVKQRAPEIYDWVLRVIEHQRIKIEKSRSENNAS